MSAQASSIVSGPSAPVSWTRENLDKLPETNPNGLERDIMFVRRSLEGAVTSKWVLLRWLGRIQPVQHWAVFVKPQSGDDHSGYVWELLQARDRIYLNVAKWEAEQICGKKTDKVHSSKIGTTSMTDQQVKVHGIIQLSKIVRSFVFADTYLCSSIDHG